MREEGREQKKVLRRLMIDQKREDTVDEKSWKRRQQTAQKRVEKEERRENKGDKVEKNQSRLHFDYCLLKLFHALGLFTNTVL